MSRFTFSKSVSTPNKSTALRPSATRGDNSVFKWDMPNLFCPGSASILSQHSSFSLEKEKTVLSTTDSRLWTWDYRPETTDWRLTGLRLKTRDYRLETTDSRIRTQDLRTWDYRLESMDSRLPTENNDLLNTYKELTYYKRIKKVLQTIFNLSTILLHVGD